MPCHFFKLFFFFIFTSSVFVAAEEEITIAENGRAYYDILLSANADECEVFAAEELKKYLSQMSGAKFRTEYKSTKKGIVVSNLDNLKGWQNAIISNKLDKDGCYAIKEKDSIFLIGENSAAVLFAVYDFLSQLGCRWLAPDFDFFDGTNKVIPVSDKLVFRYAGISTEIPVFKYRKLYVEEGRTHTVENIKRLIDWMPKARMNTMVFPINYEGKGNVRWDLWCEQLLPELRKRGITIEVGGHGYQNFMNASMENGKLYEEHPDWFGMDASGERSRDSRIVFCTSNEGAIAYLYKNISKYLKTHSEIKIFDFWPPDSEKWCCCVNCQSLGSETERHILLVNRMATLIEKDFPEVRLECLAYNRYMTAVQKTVLNKNVLLDFCPIHQSFEYQLYEQGNAQNEIYWKNLTDWRNVFEGDISVYSYYRKYAWRSLPNIIPYYMQKDMIRFRDIGLKGISVYSEPGDWFTYGVNHYVFSRLAWNPNVDVDALIKEYAGLIFGKAGKTVVFIFQELEDIVRFGCNIRHSAPKSENEYSNYLKRIDFCRAELEKENEKMDNELLRQNVYKLDLMLEYARKSILYMWQKTRDEDALDTEIRAFLKTHADEGVFIPHR